MKKQANCPGSNSTPRLKKLRLRVKLAAWFLFVGLAALNAGIHQTNFEEEKNVLAVVTETTDEHLGKDIQPAKSANANATTQQDERTIRGTVTDQSGEPIPGATVTVKGTTTGTITDMDGNFTLDIPADAQVLEFSFVGMKTIEQPIGSQSVFDIVMEEAVIGLDEVVAVGYGTQKKVTLTGAVGNIKVDEITETPVGNITSALAGRVAGLQVVNRGGQPGADGADLNIRGQGSPLVLVDGLPQDFGNIDPNEIESISVLKDASSSIYGARAGNGVILVTTKRGEEGKPTFNLNYSTSISTPTRVVELADAPLYATLVNEADITEGSEPTYSDEEIQKYRQGTDPRYPNTDWWDETFDKWAPMSDYNLNVRGGSKEVNYFISFGYLNQKSMLKSDDINFDRFSFRSNVDANITDNFTVGVDLSGRKEFREEPGRDINAIMYAREFAKPTKPAHYPDPTKPTFPGYDADFANPLPISEKDYSGYHKDNFQTIRGTLTLNYDFKDLVKGLSAETKIDYRVNDRFTKDWKTTFNYYDYNYDDETYNVVTSFNSGKNTLNEYYSKDWLAYGYFKLNYERTFNESHNLSALFLTEVQSYRQDFFSGYREGFITTAIDQLFAGSDENKNSDGGASEDGRMSYVGKLGYDYKGKYIADMVFRLDGSPKFHEDRRWGFFPAVSVGWRLSEENFIKDNFNNIDNLKLRLSYGQAGDEGDVNFNYLTGYVFGGSYIYSKDQTIRTGIESKGLANPYAKWAETSTYNIGLDGSFNNRLVYFEADAFYRKKEGMLATRAFATPSTFGATLPEENLNSQDTRGLELMIGHSKSYGDFSYDVKANVSWARSKWIHFEEPEYEDEEERKRRKVSGTWTNIAWGYEADGLFSSQEEIDNWADITNGANNNVIQPGDIRYIDQNNDGIINWKDEIKIGKSEHPEIFYGLDLNLEYKQAGLSVLFQGATNYSVFYGGGFVAPFGIDNVPFAHWENRWTEQDPDPSGPLPRVRYGAAMTHPNGFNSTFWVIENAYFIRLKNVQLYYNIPKRIVQDLGLESVRVFADGSNLGVLTNVDYRDPESDQVAARNYPHQKTLSFGVNVKF